MDSEVKVTINYNCAADDSKRDGLKGYFTNTDITTPWPTPWWVPHEANMAEGKISIKSPIAQALLNHRAGDEVTVRLRIDSVELG